MRKAPWSFVLLLSIAVSVAGQDKPDFSGRWVLENPRDPALDIAGALTARQSIVRTTVWGKPMEPSHRLDKARGGGIANAWLGATSIETEPVLFGLTRESTRVRNPPIAGERHADGAVRLLDSP
jgi:hypothetical protein